jgi:uncharacterized protein (TIGR00251 family)
LSKISRGFKVSVIVKPNSKKESVTSDKNGILTVRVNAPPIDGKANKRVVQLLAEYFKKPQSSIELVHGSSGKKKVFEII